VKRAAMIFAAAISIGANCDSNTPPPTLTVVAPQGFGEIVPGGSVDVTWEITGGSIDPSAMSISLFSREDRTPTLIVDHGSGAGVLTAPTDAGFTWAGLDTLGHAVPAGYYGLEIDVGHGPIDAGDTHTLVVQGLAFTTPAPGGAPLAVSPAAPADLDFTTSTVSTLDVELYAGTVLIKDVPVPGELRTIGRTITWDATDSTGAAVAPGTYALRADVVDAAAPASYSINGGSVVVP
jgi:hypothetical protein